MPLQTVTSTFSSSGKAPLQGPVVYVEGLFSNLYQERPAEIERYREAIENLRDSALNARDSRHSSPSSEVRTRPSNQYQALYG
jgi:hypothetical protein